MLWLLVTNPPAAATLLGLGTVVLAVGVSVPQFLRLYGTGDAAGVSLPAATNSAISFIAWTGYALYLQDPWLIASSAIGVPFAVATAVAAHRCGADRAGMWLPAAWAALLCATAVLQWADAATVVGILVGASICWQVVPAVVTAWISPDVSGIAPGGWWMLGLEGVLFLGYGTTAGLGAPALYGVCALGGALGVLARLPFGDRASLPAEVAVAGADGGRVLL